MAYKTSRTMELVMSDELMVNTIDQNLDKLSTDSLLGFALWNCRQYRGYICVDLINKE